MIKLLFLCLLVLASALNFPLFCAVLAAFWYTACMVVLFIGKLVMSCL